MDLKIVYAGDRDISVRVLKFLLQHEVKPLALLVAGEKRESHASALKECCSYLDGHLIIEGNKFKNDKGTRCLQELEPYYIICVHFPYIIPQGILDLPKHGVINLHPALLPFNRGWHTPSWAIMDKTPFGATLHFMSEAVDEGDIIYQKRIEIQPNDTAHTLYQRVKELEYEVFCEAWPSLINGDYTRKKQGAGTKHLKNDLFKPEVQQIRLEEYVRTGSLLDKLRALTTNSIDEAAYFVEDEKRFHVQVSIIEKPGSTTNNT